MQRVCLIKEIFKSAIDIFNNAMGTNFSEDNVILQGINENNKVVIFESFCSKYFPIRLKDDYKSEHYFDFYASAFVGKENNIDGILYREDKIESPGSICHIFLHELAHIFLVHNEFDGKNFYDTYCEDFYEIGSIEDGFVNAGYAIWRETVAEIIARELDNNCYTFKMAEKSKMLNFYYNELPSKDWKVYLSIILMEVLTSDELEQRKNWEDIMPKLRVFKLFKNNSYLIKAVELLYKHLRSKIFDIDVEFIMDLGEISALVLENSKFEHWKKQVKGRSNNE